MAIGKPRGKKGMRPVYVYDPAVGQKVYVGSRQNLRGAGGAQELERQKQQEFAAHEPKRIEGKLTIRGYAADWLELHHGEGTRRPAPGTRTVNEGHLRRFLEDFGDRLIDGGIGRREALRWSRKNVHAAKVVSAMFNDAVDDQECEGNPFANRRHKESRGRKHIKPLTADEVQRIAEIAHRHWGADGYGLVARAWVLFGAWVGCRPGETFGVELEDLRFDAGEVVIRRIKKRGGEYPVDTVVLPRAAIQVIQAMPVLPRTGPIFLTITGERMLKGALRYYWDPVRAAFQATVSEQRWAELLDGTEDGKNLDFYALRHFCASQIVEHGGNEYDVAAQLGNSPEVARETYIHSYVEQVNARNRRFLDGAEVRSLREAREKRESR
jgi:integrase